VASLGRHGMPNFVKHAAQHYEQASIKDAFEMMTTDLLGMITGSSRKEQNQNKEDWS
jgi:hypothetical protein